MKNLLIYFTVTPKNSYLLVKIVIKPQNLAPLFRTYKVEATTYEVVRSLVARACESCLGQSPCREHPHQTAQLALPLPLMAIGEPSTALCSPRR